MAGKILKMGGGGGGGTPGGNNLQLQWNNAGIFGGCAQLFWDSANNRLGLGDSTPAKQFSITECMEISPCTGVDVGVIYKGVNRFIHDYAHVTADGDNLFLGNNSGNFTSSPGGGASSLASNNIGLGTQTLTSLTNGKLNIAIGKRSLYFNTTGEFNVAIGYQSLYETTTGRQNIAIGTYGLRYNTIGIYNVAMGYESLNYGIDNCANIAIGLQAGRGVSGQNKSNNVLIGHKAGCVLGTGGDGNIFFGYQAGDNVTSGERNIIIGYDLDALAATGDYQLNIASTIFGDLGATKKIGINTSTMNETLNVGGAIRLGTSASTNDGTIRWTGVDFEGYDSGWKSLTASGGVGDVVGPGSAIDSAIALFDSITGKLIKDSTRLIEDALTDGSNLPDGHAIKTYGDANWAGGGGDVSGPATNTDNYAPLWDGADSKLLKNGFAITTAGKALIDDADVAAQRATLGLLSASLRNAEDIMTSGSNLPDGAAIIAYGNTNWGGGSSKWVDSGQYIYPSAGNRYRILDAGTDLSTVAFSAHTVHILAPGANYNISASLNITLDFVSIIGNGATIRKTATADGLNISGNYCSVVGVEIDGNSQGWAGVFITGSHNVIDGVVTHNNGGLGIGQDGQFTTCQYNRIVNCESYSNGEIGFSLNDVDFAVVSNNVAHDNTLEGFTCDANSPGWASSCMFDGNIGYNNTGGVGGFGIDRARNCTFSNNVIDGSGSNDGMKTQNNQGPVEYCIFTGNVLINNGGYGINITTGTAGASHHNKLCGNVYRNNTSGDYYVISGQSNIVIEAAGSGAGDVVGPASAVNNGITLFDGTTGKLIKDSARLIEDTMTDGSNLPDGHAVKTYGDANWGGGSSKWTDAGAYYNPNNWDHFRIQDTHVLEIADSASFASGFPWNDTVPYPGSDKGSMVSLGQTSSSDGNPPLWVQKKFGKSSVGNYHYAGAGHFEVWKQAASTGSAVSALTGCIQQEATSGDAIAIHGRARKHAAGNAYAGWFYAYRAPGQIGGFSHGIEIDVSNRGQSTSFSDTVGATADMGLWIYPQDSVYPNLAAIGIGADSAPTSHWNGILFNTNAVRADGVGINMTAISPLYGMKFTEVVDSHFYCASGNLVFRDTITGLKTLAELAAGGGGGLNNVVEDLTPELGGSLYCNDYEILFNNMKSLYMKDTGGTDRIGMRLSSGNDWQLGMNGHMVSIGDGCSTANPLSIRVGGVNNKQVLVGAADSGGSGYRMLRVTN
jgi:hypothetical protein